VQKSSEKGALLQLRFFVAKAQNFPLRFCYLSSVAKTKLLHVATAQQACAMLLQFGLTT
jgi:hypothetical protein